MYKKIIILGLLFLSVVSFGQNNYNKGFYLSLTDLSSDLPNLNPEVEVEKRSESKIKMVGGNDYQFNPINKDIKKSYIRKKALFYSDGTNLYINSGKFKIQTWYSKVISDNNYMIFKGGIPLMGNSYGYKQNELTKGSFVGFGGAFTGLKLALLRFPYVYNKSNEKVDLITDKNIREFISSKKELLDQYEKEANKDDLDMILNYLIKWNQ